MYPPLCRCRSLANNFIFAGLSTLGTTSVRIVFRPTDRSILTRPPLEPTDINPAPLTHILYSFADISPDSGAIKLTDSWSDEEVYSLFKSEDGTAANVRRSQKHYPGDSWSESGNNLYGCLKQV